MHTPVVWTQEQIDQMARKPFDVADNKIRQSMDAHQIVIDEIAEREAARLAARTRWNLKQNDEQNP